MWLLLTLFDVCVVKEGEGVGARVCMGAAQHNWVKYPNQGDGSPSSYIHTCIRINTLAYMQHRYIILRRLHETHKMEYE